MAKTSKPVTEMYTDGSFSGKTKRGGYAAIVPTTGEVICGNMENTTNNKMEILAVTKGLNNLDPNSHVKVMSDSQYVTKAFTNGWLRSWQRNGFMTREGKPVANQEEWNDLVQAVDRHSKVKFEWVRGHNGHEHNEAVDQLACSIQKYPK